jgi:lipoprotein-releasing system permease protein
MKLASSFLLAIKFLLPQHDSPSNARKSVVGAILCIALSLVPLIVVLVVSDGMIEGITARTVSLSSFDLQVVPYGMSGVDASKYDEYENLAQVITQVEGVKSACVERQGVALAAGKNGRTGATVRGVSSSLYEKNESFRKYLNILEGEFDVSTNKDAVIGSKLAKDLNLKVGDTIRIISSKKNTNGKIIPRFSTFKVKGICSSGYQELDALWVFINGKTAFDLFSTASSKIVIGVETENPFDNEIYKISNLIDDELYKHNKYASVYTWQELNSSQLENFATTKMLLLLIMSLIVLVASINVSSSVIMFVIERNKEIAILKSLGASSQGITFSFLLIAMFIGFCGILIGVPIGILCAVNVNSILDFFENVINFVLSLGYNIFADAQNFVPVSVMNPEYYLQDIPIVLPFGELCAIVILVLILSVVVSIIPSVKAGKEKPLSILRKI